LRGRSAKFQSHHWSYWAVARFLRCGRRQVERLVARGALSGGRYPDCTPYVEFSSVVALLREQARAAADLADGIVVGSRAVEVAEQGPDALRAYVSSLRAALDR